MALIRVENRSKIDDLSAAVSATFLAVDLDVKGSPARKFNAYSVSFASKPIGPLAATFARSTGLQGQLSGRRSRQRIASDTDEHMVFMIERVGKVHHTQYGRSVETPPGYMVLLDSRQPYEVHHCGSAASLNIRVPIGLLRSALGTPERYCGVPIDGRAGLNAVLADLLRSAWRRADDLGLGEQEALAGRMVDAIASLCLSAADRSPSIVRRTDDGFDRISRYIEANLTDPDLNPPRISSALRISKGHLHALMRQKKTSVGKLLQTLRLDRCHSSLADSRLSHQTIARIAYDWGFVDAAHFSRVFKLRFGITPREHRLRSRQCPSGY